MARDISELGADVIDDSPKPEHKISPKKRNYIIGLSITGALLIGAIVGSTIACNTILLDYSNLSNITYYYTPKTFLPEGEQPTAVLYKLKAGVKYPSTFRIPSQIKGYKVVGVADEAFVGHPEIKKVVMPNTLEFVGEKAFYNCVNLESFTWSKKLSKVGVDAFLDTKFYTNLLNSKDTLYDLPSGLLIYVGQDYFANNTALVSDEISETKINEIKTKYGASQVIRFGELNVKDICSGAFKGNNKIVYIDLPSNLTAISNSTFESCTNLKGLDSSHCELQEINKRAFANCVSLTDISLPNNLKVVGDEAFSNTALVNYIPDFSQVEELGESIFSYCESLESVVYTGDFVPSYTFDGCTSLKEISWGVNNSNIDSVYYFGMGAFQGTGFEEFIVPKSVSSISDETFALCGNLKKVSLWGNPNYVLADPDEEEPEEGEEEEEEEEEIEITSSFIDYDGVERQGTPAGIASIKANAFNACGKLTTIDLYDDSYNFFKGTDNEFTFPVSLTRTDIYTTVTGNENLTFAGTSTKKVNLGANVKSIGSLAFYLADELEEVEVTQFEQSRLEKIKASAFEGASKLKRFILPKSVTELGASIFKDCVELEEVQLENTNAKSLNDNAFYNCQKLPSLTIPESVTAIKSKAFYQNYALNYLVIPSSITQIQANTFTKMRATSEEEKMAIYFDFTVSGANKINFAGGMINRQTWHDDTVEIYFKLGDGEQKQEGYNYWNGDKTNPQVI